MFNITRIDLRLELTKRIRQACQQFHKHVSYCQPLKLMWNAATGKWEMHQSVWEINSEESPDPLLPVLDLAALADWLVEQCDAGLLAPHVGIGGLATYIKEWMSFKSPQFDPDRTVEIRVQCPDQEMGSPEIAVVCEEVANGNKWTWDEIWCPVRRGERVLGLWNSRIQYARKKETFWYFIGKFKNKISNEVVYQALEPTPGGRMKYHYRPHKMMPTCLFPKV